LGHLRSEWLIILKLVLEVVCDGVRLVYNFPFRNQWREVVNVVINFLVEDCLLLEIFTLRMVALFSSVTSDTK